MFMLRGLFGDHISYKSMLKWHLSINFQSKYSKKNVAHLHQDNHVFQKMCALCS